MAQPLLISRKVGSTNFLTNSANIPVKAQPKAVESLESAKTNKKKDKILSRKVGRENSDPDCEKFSRLIIRQAGTPCTSISSNRTAKAYRNQGMFANVRNVTISELITLGLLMYFSVE